MSSKDPKTTTPVKKWIATSLRNHRQKAIDFLAAKSAIAPAPFYSSVDLRDSGYKIAPVDNNLYPAGWNNICPEDQRTAPQIFKAQIECIKKRCKESESSLKTSDNEKSTILILPETHTKNMGYLENLLTLSQILQNAGFEVRLGWVGEFPEEVEKQTNPKRFTITTEGGQKLEYYAFNRKQGSAGSYLQLEDGTIPSLILLNNDFSSGYPLWLDGLCQPVLPPHFLGWHSRKKSEHFAHYNVLAKEFSEILGIDPWFIQVGTKEVSPINFGTGDGLEELKQACASLFDQLHTKHAEYKIKQPPFLFIKNNSGTYGMGIMTIHSIEELDSLNRRTKNKMSVGKGHQIITSVAVQEGIPTSTLVDKVTAEPVIYLAGCSLVGGFLRTNVNRGREENLNSQGMVFRKLCMSDLSATGDPSYDADILEQLYSERPVDETAEDPVLELVYGAIARLSSLSTGLEIKNHLNST